jgi:hypothetical protein
MMLAMRLLRNLRADLSDWLHTAQKPDLASFAKAKPRREQQRPTGQEHQESHQYRQEITPRHATMLDVTNGMVNQSRCLKACIRLDPARSTTSPAAVDVIGHFVTYAVNQLKICTKPTMYVNIVSTNIVAASSDIGQLNR